MQKCAGMHACMTKYYIVIYTTFNYVRLEAENAEEQRALIREEMGELHGRNQYYHHYNGQHM